MPAFNNTSYINDNNYSNYSDLAGPATSLSANAYYIQIDLGQPYNLTSLTVKRALNATGAYDSVLSAVKISNDGSSWTELSNGFTHTGWTETIVNETFTTSINSVRYIRNTLNPYNSGVSAYCRWYEIQAFVPNTELITPANNSYIYFGFPDLTYDVYFSWTDISDNYNIQVAKDEWFNVLTVDKSIVTSYTTESLEPATYWWKVRSYDTTTMSYGNFTNASTFYLIRNASGGATTSIEGFIYESINGAGMPLSESTVYIRNEALNWSSSMITGTNGYYIFSNLTNSTVYAIYAKKTGYEDSAVEYVTTTPGQKITKNILLTKCISGFNCFYNQQYIKFKIQSLFGTKYYGVSVSVYKGTDIIASYTGTTGTDGSATFLLTKDQQYRITFISAAQGINREITITPINTEYVIVVTPVDSTWEGYTTQVKDSVFMNVSKTIISGTNANVSINYIDNMNQTTSLTIYLNHTNASDPYNQTVVQTWSGSGNSTHNFTISPYSGQQFLVHFVAQHTTYGTIEKTYSIFFESVTTFPGIPANGLLFFAILCLIITAGVFTASSAEIGAIIVCGEAWIFEMMGFFSSINTAQIVTGLTVASILSVISYVSMKSKREGYS